jgi:hypothetical protein
MDTPLATRVRELLDAGGGEPLESGRFLPLATLASGARVGLDASAAWILVPDGGGPPRAYAVEQAHAFYEVLESKRDDFDDAVESAARGAELPADEILFSFPAVAVIRAVLEKGFPYLTRLALLWIRNTELRELRAEILVVSRSGEMPLPIRDLAERLLVPE